jgi:hypothetical protein
MFPRTGRGRVSLYDITLNDALTYTMLQNARGGRRLNSADKLRQGASNFSKNLKLAHSRGVQGSISQLPFSQSHDIAYGTLVRAPRAHDEALDRILLGGDEEDIQISQVEDDVDSDRELDLSDISTPVRRNLITSPLFDITKFEKENALLRTPEYYKPKATPLFDITKFEKENALLRTPEYYKPKATLVVLPSTPRSSGSPKTPRSSPRSPKQSDKK